MNIKEENHSVDRPVTSEDRKIDGSHLKLKKLRQARGVTLRQLAKDSKISLSYLSNYENGKANLTINALKKIALALGVTVAELLTDDQEQNKDVNVVRQEGRYIQTLYVTETGTALQEYLMRSNKAIMHILIGKLPPHSDTGEPDCHYGEEFIFALKGTVSAIIENVTYRINEGDMIYYRSSVYHKLANEQDTDIEYLHVNTPPTF